MGSWAPTARPCRLLTLTLLIVVVALCKVTSSTSHCRVRGVLVSATRGESPGAAQGFQPQSILWGRSGELRDELRLRLRLRPFPSLRGGRAAEEHSSLRDRLLDVASVGSNPDVAAESSGGVTESEAEAGVKEETNTALVPNDNVMTIDQMEAHAEMAIEAGEFEARSRLIPSPAHT